jgi:hypothetical protein
MTAGPDVLEVPVRYDSPAGLAARAKRHLLYTVFSVVVSAIVLFGLLEAVTGAPGYGIDSATARASSGSTSLAVRYAHATRGQLTSPFEVTVHHDGGFDGPITLAISRGYLDLFITNAVSPSAASETSTSDSVLMTFDAPPTGETMSVRWDVVAKPSSFFTSRDGFVRVVDSSGAAIVSASFTTRVHA